MWNTFLLKQCYFDLSFTEVCCISSYLALLQIVWYWPGDRSLPYLYIHHQALTKYIFSIEVILIQNKDIRLSCLTSCSHTEFRFTLYHWHLLMSFVSKLLKSWPCVTVHPKKYAHGFCLVVLCCGYTLTDFPISIRLTSLALWQSNDCPSASKATLMNMDKYFMWIHYERLHNHNKAKHNKTVCIFLGIYCICLCATF